MAEEIVKTETPDEKKEAPAAQAAKTAEDELKELKAQLAKANALISKANSENAEWKRKYRDTLSEQEKKEADIAETNRLRDEKLAQYEEFFRISQYKDKIVAAGFDNESASVMAQGLPEGIPDSYFDTLKASMDRQKQAFAASAISSQKGLSVGLPPTTSDAQKEELNRRRKAFGLPPL